MSDTSLGWIESAIAVACRWSAPGSFAREQAADIIQASTARFTVILTMKER
jgi:hypothetical protein